MPKNAASSPASCGGTIAFGATASQPIQTMSPAEIASTAPRFVERFEPDGLVPPQLAGLIAAFTGMIVGSFAFRDLQKEARA